MILLLSQTCRSPFGSTSETGTPPSVVMGRVCKMQSRRSAPARSQPRSCGPSDAAAMALDGPQDIEWALDVLRSVRCRGDGIGAGDQVEELLAAQRRRVGAQLPAGMPPPRRRGGRAA